MTLYFTSDMHFGHGNIIDYCAGRLTLPGVKDSTCVTAMNEAIIARWNETVDPDDSVIIVGDAVMGMRSATTPLLARLNGQKDLLVGNHDKPFQKTGEAYRRACEPFEAVGVHLFHANEIVIGIRDSNGIVHSVTVCHFPYYGDSTDEDRYAEMRPRDNGGVLLHGHVHDEWKVRDRMINVGVDVNDYRPVSVDEIGRIIKEEIEPRNHIL